MEREEQEKNEDEGIEEEDIDDEEGMTLFDILEPNNEETQEPMRRSSPKVGRNDPCPCGSGKKYKKCYGK